MDTLAIGRGVSGAAKIAASIADATPNATDTTDHRLIETS